ncbi:hypothetical protein [Empedobacter sedimenti]|uniref:hypothetical protein n=1 Tax=Empedobacter sedimenti TaxID=3042610 RepID=UPI0024A70551|nr:hypothetical protein [Empedobacter sedimenti]
MNFAHSMQKFQDWFTQQWIIIFGKKINPKDESWLFGPFGEIDGIGEKFINELAVKENLTISRNKNSVGLLKSFNSLNLPESELNRLSKNVIDFYENTSDYKLYFKVRWNPFFKNFGFVVNRLFSQRINQLNIPTEQINENEVLTSEIIQLIDKQSEEVKYTIWLRKIKSSSLVIYSGIYGTCILPSGTACIKAIFPLPKGNATVILQPKIGDNRELILQSIGKKFGDPGFYFLLNDAKNNYWSQFHSSFTDELIVGEENQKLHAKQTLKLWSLRVAIFEYVMDK